MEIAVYQISKHLHILLGCIATFISFPLAFFSTKGSCFHRFTGKLSVALSVLIAISGVSMLINPDFPNLWAKNVASQSKEWILFFDALPYEKLFFAWLSITLLYFCFSAVRVWARIDSVKKNGPSYSFIDVALTTALIISSCYLLFAGVWDLNHLSYHPFAFFFIELSIYMILFGVVDIATFILPPKYLVKWGFALHGYKFFSAWDGLITAFIIRLRINYSTLENIDSLYSLIAHSVVLAILWKYFTSKSYKYSASAFPTPNSK